MMVENNNLQPATETRKRHGVVHLGHPETRIPGFQWSQIAAPPPKARTMILCAAAGVVVAIIGFKLEHIGHVAPDSLVPLAWVTPFVLLLAAIAIMPFVAKHWWEHNYARVALALALIVAVYYFFFVEHGKGNLARAAAEYISFIYLLGSLFVVSGGILIRVRARATPAANTVLLLIGAVIANVFGTTGASMLLIRPYLRMNKEHLRTYHVVFFIFVVANAGGALTPIGDPPLFLGYLKGVPFFWVMEHCWPIWALAVAILLIVFFIFDTISHRGMSRKEYDGDELGPAVSLYGATNLLFISLILLSILLHAQINTWSKQNFGFEAPWRELAMVVATFGSLAFTPHRIHSENVFNYAPIREVAMLFIGIFATMIPALNYLYHTSRKGDSLPLHTPGQYYFTCGGLSSVLDNAPTYLTFLKTEMGTLDNDLVSRVRTIVKRPGLRIEAADLEGLDDAKEAELKGAVGALVKYHGDAVVRGTLNDEQIRVGFLVGDPLLNRFLIAISMSAVLFGACTYIGNGPNFMVKSIADHAGAPTPTFFGYVIRYTLPILLPVLLVIWWLFLR